MKYAQPMAAWQQARAHTDALFARVHNHAKFERPIGARHRVAFYMGHLEAFDRNLINFLLDKPTPTGWDHRFAFGIDPVDTPLPQDQVSDWPALGEIEQYMQHVRNELDTTVQTLAEEHTSGDGALCLSTAWHVMLEHRWMHAETIMYMLHQMPLTTMLPPETPETRPEDHDPGTDWRAMVTIPAGRATLGQRRTRQGYGWDNEYNAELHAVPAFCADVYPVTNGQFMRFVDAGGYRTPSLWRPEDWAWVQQEGLQHPTLWQRTDNVWMLRRVFDCVQLPLHAPVYVSYAEAHAYATWAGKRLPTEAQWQRAAYGTAAGHERLYPWGDDAPQPQHGNFNYAQWGPTRVDAHPAGVSALGLYDLLGNGWEWTRTPFAPLAGFAAPPYYPGYSADFFDGKHMVLKGGSPVTAERLLRRSFRNWFQPHYPYIYATFRCVEE